jgi:hypothetical protein
MFSGEGEHYMHAYCEIFPSCALDTETCLKQPRKLNCVLFNKFHLGAVPVLSCGGNSMGPA